MLLVKAFGSCFATGISTLSLAFSFYLSIYYIFHFCFVFALAFGLFRLLGRVGYVRARPLTLAHAHALRSILQNNKMFFVCRCCFCWWSDRLQTLKCSMQAIKINISMPEILNKMMNSKNSECMDEMLSGTGWKHTCPFSISYIRSS